MTSSSKAIRDNLSLSGALKLGGILVLSLGMGACSTADAVWNAQSNASKLSFYRQRAISQEQEVGRVQARVADLEHQMTELLGEREAFQSLIRSMEANPCLLVRRTSGGGVIVQPRLDERCQ